MTSDQPEFEEKQDLSQSLSIFLITLSVGIFIFLISQIGQMLGAFWHGMGSMGLSVSELTDKLGSDIEFLYNGDLNAKGTVVGGVVGIAACYGAARISKLKLGKVFPFTIPPVKDWLIWCGLYTVVLLFMSLIESQTDLMDEEFMERILSTITNLPLFILGVGVLIPIFEELLVRGILFKGFKDAFKGNIAVWASSIIFVFAHLAQYNIAVCLIMLPLALVLGYSRHYTGSMVIPIVVHIFNNTMVALTGI